MLSQITRGLTFITIILCGLSALILVLHLITRHVSGFKCLSVFCNQIVPAATRFQSVSVLSLWVTTWGLGNSVNLFMAAAAVTSILMVFVLAIMCMCSIVFARLLFHRFERYVLKHLDEMDEITFIDVSTNYILYISVNQDQDYTNLIRIYILHLAVKLGFCEQHFASSTSKK